MSTKVLVIIRALRLQAHLRGVVQGVCYEHDVDDIVLLPLKHKAGICDLEGCHSTCVVGADDGSVVGTPEAQEQP